MRAQRGDHITVERNATKAAAWRDGEVVGLHHVDGTPPYDVRWADTGKVTLLFPGPSTRIAPLMSGASRNRDGAAYSSGQGKMRLDVVRSLVGAAITAPSMHNAQPWLFRFHPVDNTLDLRADPLRGMPVTDPDGRGVHIGCGAALFTLRVAAADAGWHARATVLPEPGDPDLLARVKLDHDNKPEGALVRLQPFITCRHTSRDPFSERRVPENVRGILAGAARAEGARLVFPDPWHVQSLLDLVEDAEQRQRSDPAARAEIARWVRLADQGGAAQDGIPAYALGPTQWSRRAPVRDFAADTPVAARRSAMFERSPQIALLGTQGDGGRDWLVAGQALGRVLLEATYRGIATALTSQALEWRGLRWLVRDPLSTVGSVQMVLRLGYGPPAPATPRRSVDEVLDIS